MAPDSLEWDCAASLPRCCFSISESWGVLGRKLWGWCRERRNIPEGLGCSPLPMSHPSSSPWQLYTGLPFGFMDGKSTQGFLASPQRAVELSCPLFPAEFLGPYLLSSLSWAILHLAAKIRLSSPLLPSGTGAV